MKLGVVVGSVREGRVALRIAEWVVGQIQAHGQFEAVLLDLKAIGLHLLDEPAHPRVRQYTQPETKGWSEQVEAMDAFVFVTPEYNYGTPPALVNALDHLFVEWNYKAVGFVSYGGVSAGTRSVQMTKQIVTTLRMVPLVEAVNIPFFTQFLDKDSGAFHGTDAHAKAAHVMLDELGRWTGALRTLRS